MRLQTAKPTICFLVGGWEGGGAAFSTLQLIRGIDRRKYQVKVVSCGDGPYTARLAADQSCDVLNTGWPPQMRRQVATDVEPVPLGYLKLLKWIPKTVLALNRYLRTHCIDVVHTNYYHYHMVAGLACRWTGRKCVWHWRLPLEQSPKLDHNSGYDRNSEVRPDRRWALLSKLRWLVHKSTASFVWSIANSRSTADSIRSVVGDQITIIYNGIPIEPAPDDRPRLRPILGLGDDTRIVGLVGSMQPRKGHLYFLEAAARICPRNPDVHFVYIGGQTAAGEQPYNDFLLAKRSELGLNDRVHFMGSRPDAALLTADFDIATVCSLPPGEGFGLVIVEAMAHSVPVISSNVGAATEILIEGKTGRLIPPADSEALAQAIEDLLGDEQQRRALGTAGYLECKEKFDIRRTVTQVEDLYQQVLAM
ncbi:MAG: glycosyltransferase family 4 protein [Planctomycetes bacterium]|nr:glycosyltransferase family 4 protein [Planctomycetota bacterium]